MSNQIYSNDIRLYPLDVDTILVNNLNAQNISGQTGIFNNVSINNLQQDNALNKVVVWDFDTSELKYNDSFIGSTGPTGPAGQNGPTGPTGPSSSNGTFNVTFGGAISPIVRQIDYQKTGSNVTLRIPTTTSTFSGVAGNINAVGQIPTILRPRATTIYNFACIGYNNSSETTSPCGLIINSFGDIYVWNSWVAGNNFTGPGTVGFLDFTCSYLI